MPHPVIAIPVYREKPTRDESASLAQCMKILGKHPIRFVTFPELDSTAYRDLAGRYGVPFRVECFDRSYFSSLQSYNRLCLSEAFYRRFASEHDYLLICQPDAWVFRDELESWCEKNYDYIGAPWILGHPERADRIRFKAVGNGGFSLRKIGFCLETLSASGSILNASALHSLVRDKACWAIVRKFPVYRSQERLRRSAWEGRIYEDTVFSLQKYTSLEARIPSPDEALAFSFERQPALLYARNGNKLPFGCHAWQLPAHYGFWKQFIPAP